MNGNSQTALVGTHGRIVSTSSLAPQPRGNALLSRQQSDTTARSDLKTSPVICPRSGCRAPELNATEDAHLGAQRHSVLGGDALRIELVGLIDARLLIDDFS